jgi:FSR family fosmidomycin resistance protein-like MFS transporter
VTHLIFLLIEFVDELVFGLTDAAWPLIRTDLGLNYVQIGLALSLPGLIASFIEPLIGVLGDVWKRRVLILGGGIFFVISLFLAAISPSYLPLLFSFVLFHPSSGAFVSLSQASLMDLSPDRHEHNMARWTFSGSLGVVLGPLLLSALLMLGFGWRPAYLLLAAFSGLVLLLAWKFIPNTGNVSVGLPGLGEVLSGLQNAFIALRKPRVLRWLILLEFSDLMLDVLYGFLALYFVDVVGFSVGNAALAVAVWTGVGLLGDFLLIPLMERVRGLDYLRWSVIIELVLFPAFLLAPIPWIKLVLIGLMGFFNSGWYAILKANLYATLPGQSGTVMVLDNLSGFFGKFLPLGIGLAAQVFGLQWAMWLLLAGPIVLSIGLPRETNSRNVEDAIY